MKAGSSSRAVLSAAIGQLCLLIIPLSPVLAQTCKPTASAVNHICYDNTIGSKAHITNPCPCSAVINIKDTEHHGQWDVELSPGAETDQDLWPCSTYTNPTSVSITYKLKCDKADNGSQGTAAKGSEGSGPSGTADNKGSTEGGTDANKTSNNADGIDWKAMLATVCTGRSITAPNCAAFCREKGWAIDHEANTDCINHCTHARARCEAARRQDINTLRDEDTLMVITREYLDRKRDEVKAKLEAAAKANAAAAAKAPKVVQKPRQERQQARPQTYSPPVASYRPPVEVNVGYPPGCRNKANYDLCAMQGQGCDAHDRFVCQDICRNLCNY
jgi:hypothetical protein